MQRRSFLLSMLVPVLAAGCTPKGGGEAKPGEGEKVKLALNWVAEPEFGGFYAAREGGAYKKHGLDVDILTGGAGAPVIQMVATGQADFGVTAADELLTARARGVDILPIYAVFQTAPIAIMAHASRGAKGLKDVLSSGTLAMEPGLPYTAYLKKKYGELGAKIVPYDGGVARFVADKDFAQQCYASSEPIAARKRGADPQIFMVSDEGFNPYHTVVIVRRALWQSKPDAVKAFARATREGWRSYLDDPKPANAVMQKLNTAMDAETFAAGAQAQTPLIETAETKQKGLGVMTRERWETLARQLVELGIIDKMPKLEEFLVPIE